MYQLGELVSVRVPLIAGLVRTELTVAGLCLVAAGIVVLLRRRPRDAALCLMGAFGVIALTTNMSSDEDQGFLLPAFALLWLLAGAGLQWAVCALRDAGAGTGRGRRAVGVAAIAACAMVPSIQVIQNYRGNDHHNRTFETRYFNALFDMLPSRSAILDDKYSTSMMIEYKLLGEDAAAGRDVVTVPVGSQTPNEKLRQGYQVFAFEEARSTLEKLGYQFEPVRLFDVPLPQDPRRHRGTQDRGARGHP